MGRHERTSTTLLHDEEAERCVLGICLSNQNSFWDCFAKLEPEHFTVPRHARIWDAMKRCADKAKPVSTRTIPLFIRDDRDSEPLQIFLGVLLRDAPSAGDLMAYVETVQHLHNKRQLIEALDHARQDVLSADVGISVEDMVDQGIARLVNSKAADLDADMRTYAEWGNEVYINAAKVYERGEDALIGFSTGLRACDEVMGKLLPGKLYVLAGMSSGGKSALARQMAESAARQAADHHMGQGYIASLEMPGEEHAARALAQRLGISATRIESGDLNAAEIESLPDHIAALRNLPIIVDQRPRLNIDMIRSRMLRVKNRGGLAFGVVDHLLLVKPTNKRQDLMDRVEEATQGAKDMAKEFHIPMILLAQLKEDDIIARASMRPHSGDLFGGKAILRNADVVMFLHRPEIVLAKKEPPKSHGEQHSKWLNQMEDLKGHAEVFNDKWRGGERGLTRNLRFRADIMTFEDV